MAVTQQRTATLNHERKGTGEPLVLIHGFGSHLRVWDQTLPFLTDRREVITVDLPGFGLTPPGPAHPTPRALAEGVAAFLDALRLERAHVAGFSMGGWITLELNKLGRTLSACAICPAGFWNRRERAFAKASLRNSRATMRMSGDRLAKLLENPTLRRALNRQYFEHAERLSPQAAWEASQAFAGAPGFDSTIEALHEGHFTGAREVRAPVTVAWGDKDKLLLPRQAERARRALPQARHVWLPGCGHGPMVDDPATTARAILTSA